MPDRHIPIPFKEDLNAVWADYPSSGYYSDSFDEESNDTTAEDCGQLTSATLDVSAVLSIGAAPPATIELLIHDTHDEYPHGHDPEDAWWGNVYGFPDQAADVVPQLFPPAPAEPIETFAAQPHYGDDYATYIPLETDDYAAPPEQLEFLAPPEVQLTELLASQPLSEQPWFGEQEPEDYLAPADQSEPFAPPEVPLSELAASQPHFGEWLWDAEQTEDYANDSSLDVTAAFFSAPPEPVETFAAQSLPEQPWFPDTELEDYQGPAEQSEAFAPPEVPTTELAAAQPHFGEYLWPDQDTEDYQQDSTLDVTPAFYPVAVAPDEIHAAQLPFGEWFWEDQPTDDYANDSTLDVSAFLASGEPVESLAAQFSPDQTSFDQDEPDYNSDTPHGVEAATLLDALFAAIGLPEHHHHEVDTWTDPPLDEGWLANLAGAPAGAGPVRGPTRKTRVGQDPSASMLGGPNQTTQPTGGNEAEGQLGTPGVTRVGEGHNDLEDA